MDEEEQQQCLITATVSEFKHEKNNFPGIESELTYHKEDKIYFGYTYPKIYLNGDSFINEGYVSIHIRSDLPFRASYEDITITNIVSVIDIDRNERFLRSFTFDWDFADTWISFKISRYIARETLLNESSDLLPNNCLTVHIYMILGNLNPAIEKYHNIIRANIFEGLYADLYICKLNLSSHVGQRLYELSSVFRDMLDLTNDREMLIELSAEEYAPFQYICTLIMDCDYIRFSSLEDLYEVYKLADKYDVQFAVEACQLLLKSVFRSKNQKIVQRVSFELHNILEDAMRDEYLKEIIKNFLEKTEANFQDASPLVWTCELSAEDDFYIPVFIFSKKKSEKFDFYS